MTYDSNSSVTNTDTQIYAKLEMWADAQRDGRPAEYRWPLCKSSVIPFLVPRHKIWLTPAARVPCSNAANIAERKTWT